ncbi:LytR family transcriptional regulator [Mycolicibacterium sp. P9-64]|uniref:LCP family protein n=1 Tax=Mycolicibacterium sp. P9-64 TaxID=2024612 RepID=UPI0011EBEC74|nr:LCP family protein [Mycolicibacterium sp. P9-64]KAA0085441.1 LytR family transcriptional regulator [Mycolicibacterium sp. P9-64]
MPPPRQPPPAQRRPPPPAPPHRPPSPPLRRSAVNRPAPPRNPPPSPPRAAKPRRKRRWGRILVLYPLVILLIVAAALVGTGFWLDGHLHRVAALPDYPERPSAGRGTTWLLVGSDSRQGLTPQQQAELATGGDLGAGRTDTLLVIHVPGFGSDAPTTMVSIPRDSYVEIPGHGQDKINAAFTIGGAPLLAQTVEQATGMRLDHYAEVGFDGFAQMVDAVGGVTMCPPEPINDPLAGIDLPAGCQELDGRTALGFVRTRATPRADLDRMINQREFMSALMHRAANPVVWANPLRWYPMTHAASGSVTVDDGAHIWDLIRLAWSLHGTITTTTVPIGEFTGSDAGSVVVWNDDAAHRLFAALASDEAVPPDVLDAAKP